MISSIKAHPFVSLFLLILMGASVWTFHYFDSSSKAKTQNNIATPQSTVQTTGEGEYPAPIAKIIAQWNVQIVEHFTTPSGLESYVGIAQGRPVALYLTPDKQYVILGSMFDAQANNLTNDELQKRVVEPMNQQAWQHLEQSHWILDGDKNAPVIVYAFMDPRCPYCHKFREQADPWVKAGKVQIRHIIVGILGPQSEAKAATILGSADQSAAVLENQDNFTQGGIAVDESAAKLGEDKMHQNTELMQNLGLTGTPSIYYVANGKVELARGMPSATEFIIVMGGIKP